MATEEQRLTAQRDALAALGVDPDRVYVDHGFTGKNKNRAELREALAACRAGDTFVVPKLDRLARSVHDPSDPTGKLLFNVLAMIAEFEAHLLELHDASKHPMAEMAELFSISRSTVYRAVESGHRKKTGTITPGPLPGTTER